MYLLILRVRDLSQDRKQKKGRPEPRYPVARYAALGDAYFRRSLISTPSGSTRVRISVRGVCQPGCRSPAWSAHYSETARRSKKGRGKESNPTRFPTVVGRVPITPSLSRLRIWTVSRVSSGSSVALISRGAFASRHPTRSRLSFLPLLLLDQRRYSVLLCSEVPEGFVLRVFFSASFGELLSPRCFFVLTPDPLALLQDPSL